MGSGVRMNDERLYVSHVGKERENLKSVDERPRFLFATLYLEGEDASPTNSVTQKKFLRINITIVCNYLYINIYNSFTNDNVPRERPLPLLFH